MTGNLGSSRSWTISQTVGAAGPSLWRVENVAARNPPSPLKARLRIFLSSDGSFAIGFPSPSRTWIDPRPP